LSLRRWRARNTGFDLQEVEQRWAGHSSFDDYTSKTMADGRTSRQTGWNVPKAPPRWN